MNKDTKKNMGSHTHTEEHFLTSQGLNINMNEIQKKEG